MNKELIGNLAWGVGIVVLALGARFAREQGMIDEETTTRIVMCGIGLMVAWFGNQMPKRFVPEAWARQITRVAGWSMALSGLIYAGLWVFAPVSVAIWGGCGAIIVGMAVTFIYGLSLRSKATA
jgi:hypothetical protein